MKEDMQRLGSDIQVRNRAQRGLAVVVIGGQGRLTDRPVGPQLEMNTRKEETGTELQSLDKRVMVRFRVSPPDLSPPLTPNPT